MVRKFFAFQMAMIAFSAFVIEPNNSLSVLSEIEPVFEEVGASRNGRGNFPNDDLYDETIGKDLF